MSCFFTISLSCQVPDGELHAAGAGQSVRNTDSGLERRGADTRDGLHPARHRGRREAGQGAHLQTILCHIGGAYKLNVSCFSWN